MPVDYRQHRHLSILFIFVFPGFFLRKPKENLYEIVYVLRPLYTGDFCCYLSGDFWCDVKRDFTSKLRAIQIAAESAVVYTMKLHLKSQQKSPITSVHKTWPQVKVCVNKLALWNSNLSSSDRQTTFWLHSFLYYRQISMMSTKSIDRSSSLSALLVFIGVKQKSKTAGDDGNVGKTTRLITKYKKRLDSVCWSDIFKSLVGLRQDSTN